MSSPISTIAPSHRQSAQQRERLKRLSRNNSIYESIESTDSADTEITPAYKATAQDTGLHPAYIQPVSGLTFSGQLLNLGLKYNVEGLVQKAQQQLSYEGANRFSPHHKAARSYERSQDNFARDSLNMVAREF